MNCSGLLIDNLSCVYKLNTKPCLVECLVRAGGLDIREAAVYQ